MSAAKDVTVDHRTTPLSRRRFAQLGAAAVALALTSEVAGGTPAGAAEVPARGAAAALSGDEVARTYHRVLLTHTRWTETQWDAGAGHYTAKDFGFAVVLGHALLLTRGGYDAELAGVDRETLRSRTLATLSHFAAFNRLTGGSEWGRTLFFDTTFQLYFVLAARLLWDELDGPTRERVDTIVREQARYTASLGTGDDPASGDWTPNGLLGGHVGDTKLEEMGVYAQSLAPGLAWAQDDADHEVWRAAYGRWSRNETGLPAADRANPALVDGVPVSDNTAHNLYDTFLVENHGSFGPHYQCELWRTSGRNAVHFLTAGRPLPEVLTAQPNGDLLWQTIMLVMSDAGEPLMPMVEDREHLYGRDVIPVAFRAQVLGDGYAAWAEQALARRLAAYQAYPPQYRVAKFSGEPKYEPEARAEIAISYLLHEWRARQGWAVRARTGKEFFAHARGVRDFGAGPGLVAHQSPAAWAGAVSKPGFVKFAWQPGHDDWLFRLSGATPMFLPSTAGVVRSRSVTTYAEARDGLDATATLLGLDGGFAGLTTLPGGEAVYATSGTGAGEGHLEVFNLTMPGVPGLEGARTYTGAGGTVTVKAADVDGTPPSEGRTDDLVFTPSVHRYLRMAGVRGEPRYGYSLFAFEARDGAGGGDLARGATATASSSDTGRGPGMAVDGDPDSRWAVSVADRGRADSWLAVDLGAPRRLDRVRLSWEAAAGRAYRVQGSPDGKSWTDLVRYPEADLTDTGGWLGVDGRAGLVVRGARNPVAMYGDTVVLSDGPAEPLVVEALPDGDVEALRAAAGRAAPRSAAPAVRAGTAGGHLSVFNLSDSPVTTVVTVPQGPSVLRLFAGEQTVTDEGSEVAIRLGAASAAVLPARFTVRAVGGGRLPSGLRTHVVDAATLTLSGPACRLVVTSTQGGERRVTLRGGERRVRFPATVPYPLADLARGRTTFPSSPLPAGMSDPAAAVDGDPHTAWTPGEHGRMVVDLGAATAVGRVEALWTGTPVKAAVEHSTDGVTWSTAGRLTGSGRTTSLRTTVTARYLALAVEGWSSGAARLASLSVTAPGS
ncbi:discoidin domain-containing protein [Streptomyces sp. NPDC059740]|uniref:discoidin domain-containing protein n=1 Tax=Streptomyces sp. NPDC059740 TaxID=3346926 RepID=UPI00364B33C6